MSKGEVMQKTPAVVFMLVSVVALAVQQPPSIRNFLRLNEEVCTGGQPTMEELARLKAQGVKAVINLRRPSEYNAEEEAAKARDLGLRYFNIPVDSTAIKDEQVAEFLKLTDDPANRPVFIHCTSANRVGAFWMIRRVVRDGWSVENAEAEARKIGLRDGPARDFALDYLRRHKKPA